MRVRMLMLSSLFAALGACRLPRPVDTGAYLKDCEQSGQPAADALLFVTTRLPDCRVSSRIAATWHRGQGPMYGAWGSDNVVRFYTPGAWHRAAEARLGGGRKALMYIHGYNNSNLAALGRAVAIRTAIANQREVIAFTWPSYDTTAKYFWDEANAEWASADARGFVKDLAARHPGIILVAHSMGNRIALDVVESFAPGKAPVDRLIMASPDVDRAALKRRLDEGLGVAVTLYGSRRDQPLSASWRSHGYPRAGDLADWVTGHDPDYTLHNLSTVDVVDTSDVTRGLLHHADFIETMEGAADLCRVVGKPDAKAGRKAVGDPPQRWLLVPGGPAEPDDCSESGASAYRWLMRKPVAKKENGGRGKD